MARFPRLVACAGLVALAACVHYRPAPVTAPALAAAAATPPTGPLAFEEAVRFAVANNPDLRALRARVAAINLEPPAESIGVMGEYDMDGRYGMGISLDALSLLGLGPRQAERVLARARRDEALRTHHARARALAGEIAEAYAVARALEGLPVADVHVEAQAYVRAGLEAEAAEGAVVATDGEWAAEQAARQAEATTNRLLLLRRLGSAPGASVSPVLKAPDWPAIPEPSRDALLAARADLQARLAAYEVADAELRRAIAAQYPGLVIEPGIAFAPSAGFGGIGLRLPVGADREATAAFSAREAAGEEVASAVLDALSEAAQAREASRAAEATLSAARARATSSQDLFKTAKARLETGSGMLIEAVYAAREVVMAAKDAREAAVGAARARVAAARAAGWPGPEAVR